MFVRTYELESEFILNISILLFISSPRTYREQQTTDSSDQEIKYVT